MGTLLKTFIRAKGGLLAGSLDRATKQPQAAQEKLLLDILRINQDTEYGREHAFSSIRGDDAFARQIPVNTFSDLSPYVERMKQGEQNILTVDRPLMFNVTSGTTDKPKYLPVTRKGLALTSAFSDQWLYRVLKDHPSFLDQSFLCITGSSLEGRTPCGIPFGSASGLIYRNLPRILRPSFVLPFVLSDIKDYDLRYYLMARIALEKKVSCAMTPNPTTLVRIAETAVEHQGEIVRSINDGVISSSRSFDWNRENPGMHGAITALLKPNRLRAMYLEQIFSEHGRLIPSAYWKELKIIGCWLGGSIGFQADKLTPLFGEDVPKRDLGHRASEGSMTIPYQDNTPAGILALHNNYYEFIPDSGDSTPNMRPLLCHEIEQGKRYKIVVTNYDGLYRYDIHDIVEVQGFYNRTPVIAFVRKSEDMLNITGEKLHANHFLKAFASLKERLNVSVVQFRAIPNYDKARYEILVHLEPVPHGELLRKEILPFIDRQLSEANVEYESKRKSRRLNPPCIHVMDPSWEENVRRHFMASGHRDIQYKWQMVMSAMTDIDAEDIRQTIEM